MSRARRALVFGVLLLASVSCDHAAKQIAREALSGAAPSSLAGDSVRFELTTNAGAFLSLGAGLPEGLRSLLFVGLVPLLVALLCVVALRAGLSSRTTLVGLSLIAGGGLANWLDRLLHDGAVTDFVSLGLGPLRTGIFNLADVCVVAGVALLVFSRDQGLLLASPARASLPNVRE